MKYDDVAAGLVEVLSEAARVDPADVTPEKRLYDDLGLDSLTMLDVVVAAEDRFGVLIPDDTWPRFVTVDEIVRHLQGVDGIT
jgi:acyl carrier protein